LVEEEGGRVDVAVHHEGVVVEAEGLGPEGILCDQPPGRRRVEADGPAVAVGRDGVGGIGRVGGPAGAVGTGSEEERPGDEQGPRRQRHGTGEERSKKLHPSWQGRAFTFRGIGVDRYAAVSLHVRPPTRPSWPMRTATYLPALVLLALLTPSALAQGGVGCLFDGSDHSLRQPRAFLDVNGVRAGLFNRGQLFFTGGDPHYEVPKGSGVHAIFEAGIWMGGLVDGELRIAAATYAQGGQNYEFFPGPLGADGSPPTDCTPYDRIWTVSRADLHRYAEAGIATDDLAEWPGELGAPFFDADGDGAYSLEAGDRPKVWGDQTAWWVMNDAAGPHLTTLSEPLGMEVRVTAFASASPEAALFYATFYRYELT